jgi:hypothetical protein
MALGVALGVAVGIELGVTLGVTLVGRLVGTLVGCASWPQAKLTATGTASAIRVWANDFITASRGLHLFLQAGLVHTLQEILCQKVSICEDGRQN